MLVLAYNLDCKTHYSTCARDTSFANMARYRCMAARSSKCGANEADAPLYAYERYASAAKAADAICS